MHFVFILIISLGLVYSKYYMGHHRYRRYLVYPNGNPARAQFILGLGIPVDLKEQTVTVGTVIKFQYDLPDNSSEYTTRFYGFANTVSRNLDDDDDSGYDNGRVNKQDIHIKEEDVQDINRMSAKEIDAEDDDVLVDINFNNNNVKRKKRELTLEEAIERQEIIDNNVEEDEPPRRANRWDYYKIFEHMIERYGYSGRPCLLQTICEAAKYSFTHESGLLAEIGHVVFTPSTTKDELYHHTDNEYHAAERLGRDQGVDCQSMFPECEASILETFTEIGLDTLHQFGVY